MLQNCGQYHSNTRTSNFEATSVSLDVSHETTPYESERENSVQQSNTYKPPL